MYHPLELNAAWQSAARKLKSSGYTYQRITGSVVPGIFTKTGATPLYLIARPTGNRTQAWVPVVAADIPKFFNASSAATHTGMARITIKMAIARGDIPSEMIGARAKIVSDSDLLKWLESRHHRGATTATYRSPQALRQSAKKSLQSMLWASVRARDINFEKLFSALKKVGVTDPPSVMLDDIEHLQTLSERLSRQELIETLEVKGEDHGDSVHA